MGIVKTAQLRCRDTVSHNHPVNFVNEIYKLLDNFAISNPFCFIISDQMEHLIIYRLWKNLASSMFRENNIGVLILNGRDLKYSNFQILTTESSIK